VIGARFSARRPSPKAASWLAAAGVAIGALGVAADVAALVPVAVAPIAVAIALVLVPERRFAGRFAATGLELAHPRLTIPYSSLLEVRPLVSAHKARPDSFPIQVVHARGALVVPARLTHSSERVYSFLRDRIPRHGVALPPALESYRAEQEARFGADKVWSCGGRRGADLPTARNLRPVAIGLLATAAVWAVLPLRRANEDGWWAAAVLMAMAGIAVFAWDLALRRRETSGAKAAGATAALVIAPNGLAVQQGALSGHLTWEEIRKIGLRSGRTTLAWSRADARPGLVIEVEGAAIVLTDSYDRPLAEIHGRIQRLWR
jgi:hypothetical protein